MTYNVFGGTLSLTQSINQSVVYDILGTARITKKKLNFVLYPYWIVYQLVEQRPVRHRLQVRRDPRVAHRKPDNTDVNSTRSCFLRSHIGHSRILL